MSTFDMDTNENNNEIDVFAECKASAIKGGVIGTIAAMALEAISRNSSGGTIVTAGVFGAVGAAGMVLQPVPIEMMLASGTDATDLETIKKFALYRAAGVSFSAGYTTSRLATSFKKLENGACASKDNSIIELE